MYTIVYIISTKFIDKNFCEQNKKKKASNHDTQGLNRTPSSNKIYPKVSIIPSLRPTRKKSVTQVYEPADETLDASKNQEERERERDEEKRNNGRCFSINSRLTTLGRGSERDEAAKARAHGVEERGRWWFRRGEFGWRKGRRGKAAEASFLARTSVRRNVSPARYRASIRYTWLMGASSRIAGGNFSKYHSASP